MGTDDEHAPVKRHELNELRQEFLGLRDGLLGTPDFPGGKLNEISDEIAAMPQKILHSIDDRRRASRKQLLIDSLKIIAGIAGAIFSAWVAAHI